MKKPGLSSDPAVNFQPYPPQQQGWAGHNAAQVAPPAYNQPPADFGRFNLYQQPVQAEVVGSQPPAWRELAARPPQQQYVPYHQNTPYAPHQSQVVSPVETPVHEIQSSGPGDGGRPGWHRYSTPLAPPSQPTQVYEVAGTRNQKN
jgi:hypothetical protein